jgi:hypothetical protein
MCDVVLSSLNSSLLTGNGKIEKHEFMAAMSEWMHSAAEVQAPQSRLNRPLGSPPTSSSRKKAANSMVSV